MRTLINSCTASCWSVCRTSASLIPSCPTCTTGVRWCPSERKYRRCLPVRSSANVCAHGELAIFGDRGGPCDQRVEEPQEEEEVGDAADAAAAEGEELPALADAQHAVLHRHALDLADGARLVAAEEFADGGLLSGAATH